MDPGAAGIKPGASESRKATGDREGLLFSFLL